MTSKPVAQLLVDIGVPHSHSRPHVSNDNPYSEVRALMLELSLVTCQPRPRVSLTKADGAEHHLPDLLPQDVTADRPGTTMIGNITYVPTWQGWHYLATVIDVHTRMVIGYAMDEHLRTPPISAALRNACAQHDVQPHAIFHSDRGSTPPPSSPPPSPSSGCASRWVASASATTMRWPSHSSGR